MGNRDSVGILLALTLAIALFLTACTGSQEKLADAPVLSPTSAPSVTPVFTPTSAVATPAASPTATVQYFPDINNLGSAWETEVSDTAEPGEQKTYSHYPPTPPQYDALFVDDELVSVDYICADETRDLTGWFAPAEEEVGGVVPYKSWPIDFFRQGCRIDFTVKNTEGNTLGLRFLAHCPTCHN